MDIEIKRENWADFFESLSKRRYEWKTMIEVFSPDSGHQTFTEGLPLNGMTVEARDEQLSIEISVGAETGRHVTHNIVAPDKVAFLAAADAHQDVIDIEEADGTKTLISFVEPMGLLIGFMEAKAAAAAN